jgi:hypothetical protein
VGIATYGRPRAHRQRQRPAETRCEDRTGPLTPLELAPSLEEFALIEANGSVPSEAERVLRNPALRSALAGFGSAKKNRLFESMREKAGSEAFHYATPFRYEELGT